MTEQDQVRFEIREVKRRSVKALGVLIIMVPCLFVFGSIYAAWTRPDDLLSFVLEPSFLRTVLTSILFSHLALNMDHSANDRVLTLGNDELTVSCGLESRVFPYHDIQKVTARRDAQGHINFTLEMSGYRPQTSESLKLLRFKGFGSLRPISKFLLLHFERSEVILNRLREKLGSDKIVEQDRTIYVKFLILGLLALGVLNVWVFNLGGFDDRALDVALGVTGIAAACWGMFEKSFSRMYVERKWIVFDVVFGLVFIYWGLSIAVFG